MDNELKVSAQRLKSAREAIGFSLATLGKMVGMSKSTLQRYESGGIKNMPVDSVRPLANALQVTPEYLLGIDAEKDEVMELRDALRRRPGMRMLFSVAREATEEDIIKVVRMLEIIKERDNKGNG
jgi:transcriptional regulator with XRE-family HTH domain